MKKYARHLRKTDAANPTKSDRLECVEALSRYADLCERAANRTTGVEAVLAAGEELAARFPRHRHLHAIALTFAPVLIDDPAMFRSAFRDLAKSARLGMTVVMETPN